MKEKLRNILHEIDDSFDPDAEGANIAEDLDSIDIIELLSEIEDCFHVTVSMKEKTEENFANLDTLAKMIERLQSA